MVAAPKVLVVHASAAGSTAGIAQRISDVLGTAGVDAVCRPAAADLDLTGYDAVVLGSAVHDMAWLPAAVDVAGRVAAADVPVWCFSVGAVSPRGRFTWYLARKEAESVQRGLPAGLVPREHRVFGGVVEPRRTPFWARPFALVVGTRPGDHRDWAAVDEWARNIADALGATRRTAPYAPPRPPAAW